MPKNGDVLTDVELEIMTLLWCLGTSSANEVKDAASRPLAYTSVSTILRILEKKGFVTAIAEGRRHRYTALISKAEYEQKAIDNIAANLFAGKRSNLIRSLVEADQLSPDEILELRQILDAKDPSLHQ